jgi:hypothetical protein
VLVGVGVAVGGTTQFAVDSAVTWRGLVLIRSPTAVTVTELFTLPAMMSALVIELLK